MRCLVAEYDYDLFVIGAGSGGVRAARFSANAGARGRLDRDLIARLFGGVLHPGTAGGVLDRVKGYSGLMCR